MQRHRACRADRTKTGVVTRCDRTDLHVKLGVACQGGPISYENPTFLMFQAPAFKCREDQISWAAAMAARMHAQPRSLVAIADAA